MALSLMWNWQIPDWPKFTWDQKLLDQAEKLFLVESGEFGGTVRRLEDEDLDLITVEALSTEAATTSYLLIVSSTVESNGPEFPMHVVQP